MATEAIQCGVVVSHFFDDCHEAREERGVPAHRQDHGFERDGTIILESVRENNV